MRSSNIHLVVAEFGSWDDHRLENVKAFENKDDAIAYAHEYERVIGNLSKFVAECWHKYMDADDAHEDEHSFEAKIWAKYHRKFESFQQAMVFEMPLVRRKVIRIPIPTKPNWWEFKKMRTYKREIAAMRAILKNSRRFQR